MWTVAEAELLDLTDKQKWVVAAATRCKCQMSLSWNLQGSLFWNHGTNKMQAVIASGTHNLYYNRGVPPCYNKPHANKCKMQSDL